MHFHTPGGSNNPGSVYMKVESNFSESELQAGLESEWNKYVSSLPSGPGGSGVVTKMTCPNFYLSPSWRTRIGNNGSNFYDCAESTLSASQYISGFSCGVADAALDQILFLHKVAMGLIDFARYGNLVGLSNIPGGEVYFFRVHGVWISQEKLLQKNTRNMD